MTMMNFDGLRARFGQRAAFLAICTVFGALPAQSHADLVFGDSSSFGLSTNVEASVVNGVLTSDLTVGPTSTSSGTAPGPYSEMGSNPGVSASAQILTIDVVSLNTGQLTTTADSDITSSSPSGFVSSSAAIADLTLGALSGVLSLEAEAITSSANVSGIFGSLDAIGDASILGAGGEAAVLSVLGVDFVLDASSGANTSIVIDSSSDVGLANLVGSIEVFVNEQIETGDGATDSAIEVNALRLSLNGLEANVGDVGLVQLDGDLIFAHSEAALSAVPEASPILLVSVVGLGIGAVVRVRQRRNRAQRASGKT